MNQRKLTPEILDELPPDDPAAIRSRKDLKIINRMMGNYSWISSRMAEIGGLWLELGAGAGSLSGYISDRGKLKVTGVDFAPCPERWPEEWSWHQGDLFAFLADQNHEAKGIAANLFLHHFTDDQLGEIGKRIPSRVDTLVFSEPARYFSHKIQGWLGFPIFNHVTRHDMIVSIEAGFRGDELAEAMRLSRDEWQWQCSRSFWGAYRFEARRRLPGG
ncbi:MAG: class I SAM-dependent methyltransferase [Verrucomicrobiales bacterium]|nr:class I SAM-dependent methyltransferase [Verrucomicrobiales bacterium]